MKQTREDNPTIDSRMDKEKEPHGSKEYISTEIAKFNKIAHDFWNEQSSFKALHQINPLRCQFISEHINLKDKKVIDIGCGGGILSESLFKSGAKVSAIDLSQRAIEVAKNHQMLSNMTIDYQLITSYEMAKLHHGEFDAVCCMEMLEHVDNPQDIIEDCADLVTDNGFVFVSTLNRTQKANLLAIILAENIGMVPKGTHDYQQFIKPSELIDMAKDYGLTAKSIKGISFRPLHQDFVISKNVDINYMIAFQKTK